MNDTERTRLEELLVLWQDQSIQAKDLDELKKLLATPEGRSRMVDDFTISAVAMETLREEREAGRWDEDEKRGEPTGQVIRRESWFHRWGWAAMISISILASVVFYAYTRIPVDPISKAYLALSGRAVSSIEVELSWKGTWAGAQGFSVERGPDGVNFSEIARVGLATASYRDTPLSEATEYHYRIRAFNAEGASPSSSVLAVRTPPPTVVNISTRGFVGTGENELIGGFWIEGLTSKKMLIRARGPSVADTGPKNVLANPYVELITSKGKLIARNDDWQTSDPLGPQSGYIVGGIEAIKATGLDPTGTNSHLESVLLITLPPGGYTAIMRGVDGGTGVGLIEVFEINK